MASVQRMLTPMANAIVGSAMHVASAKKSRIRPAYNIARGVKRRGRKTMVGKGLAIIEDVPTNTLIVKFNNEKVAVVPMDDTLIKLSSPKMLGGKAVRSLLSRIFYGSKPGKKITKPMRQLARRFGLISAGVGGAGVAAAGTTGAAIGYGSGKKKGGDEGYIRALEDILSASKSTKRGNMIKAIDKAQKNGLPLDVLKKLSKQITAVGVPALELSREDLQPSKRKRYKRKKKKLKKGYIPAMSKPVGFTTPPYKAKGKPSKTARVKGNKNTKFKDEEAKKNAPEFMSRMPLSSGYFGTGSK